ncbi:hypothetical protein K458DRAFT_490055 [Lentithecium fluviatile CBS 122367]|uniref:Uncharacterized protein n=1 Tax=Lentithecium fluviatile CBS 122367 TaxID=1168545 RepID=A0A6G1IQ85_9PLEO|nr:hypothetical protein K458DRAFT_490055 [Lentithecium fluviatile CBS 122367]
MPWKEGYPYLGEHDIRKEIKELEKAKDTKSATNSRSIHTTKTANECKYSEQKRCVKEQGTGSTRRWPEPKYIGYPKDADPPPESIYYSNHYPKEQVLHFMREEQWDLELLYNASIMAIVFTITSATSEFHFGLRVLSILNGLPLLDEPDPEMPPPHDTVDFSLEGLVSLIKACQMLERIWISNVPELCNDTVSAILHTSRHLEAFHLSLAPKDSHLAVLIGSVFSEIEQYNLCKNLRYLKILNIKMNKEAFELFEWLTFKRKYEEEKKVEVFYDYYCTFQGASVFWRGGHIYHLWTDDRFDWERPWDSDYDEEEEQREVEEAALRQKIKEGLVKPSRYSSYAAPAYPKRQQVLRLGSPLHSHGSHISNYEIFNFIELSQPTRSTSRLLHRAHRQNPAQDMSGMSADP